MKKEEESPRQAGYLFLEKRASSGPLVSPEKSSSGGVKGSPQKGADIPQAMV